MTLTIRSDHRARLLELAARRGQRGLSPLIEEAIEAYLGSRKLAEERRRAALRLRGCLEPVEAAEMRVEARRLRES